MSSFLESSDLVLNNLLHMILAMSGPMPRPNYLYQGIWPGLDPLRSRVSEIDREEPGPAMCLLGGSWFSLVSLNPHRVHLFLTTYWCH